MNKNLSRRRCLKNSFGVAGGLTIPNIFPASVLGRGGTTPSSERIGMGFIGLGRQGTGHYLSARMMWFQGLSMVLPQTGRKRRKPGSKSPSMVADPGRGSRVFRTDNPVHVHSVSREGRSGYQVGVGLGWHRPVDFARTNRPGDPTFVGVFSPSVPSLWNIYTTNGKVHTGIQLDHQSRGAMLLYTMHNYNRRFEADEVKRYEASPDFLMPPGLENTMTLSEFRDLIAYFSFLK